MSTVSSRKRNRSVNSTSAKDATNGHTGDEPEHSILLKVASTLSKDEIAELCGTQCSIFISYLYYTNAHSLYNVLSLQHNLELQNISCCAKNCTVSNHAGDFYLCLHCIFYCCSSPDHLTAHCQLGHYLYFELSSQSIYCCKCGQYHHSPWTDSMILKFAELAQRRLVEIKQAEGNGNKSGSGSMSSSNADSECPDWKQMEIIDLKQESNLLSLWRHFDCVRDNGLLGIRGSLNLGNTCYFTAILQAFIHNDQMRNYYLSGVHSDRCKRNGVSAVNNTKHNSSLSKSPSPAPTSSCSNPSTIGCVSCEVEEVYSDFYCGLNNAPVPITNLIGTIWQHDEYQLNNQMMHDSHELFIALTSLLCKTSSERSEDERNCQCIVHSTFRGLWCSELKCTNAKCKHVSSTLATFMEINLQFRRKETSQSVEDALKDYMESELLSDYKCSKCGEKRVSKQNTIHSLPQTLCLHLKRFEADEMMKELSASAKGTASTHSRSASPNNVTTRNTRSRRNTKNGKNGKQDQYLKVQNRDFLVNGNGNGTGNGGYQKMEDIIHFPVDSVLDLSRFVNVNRKDAKVNKKQYRLKSCILHSGDMSAGHYVCWIRKEDRWYYCDDHKIQLSNADYVQSAKAYMLFYEAQ